MSSLWTLILLVTVASINHVNGDYLVLAPKLFRPGTDYSIEVSIVGASSSVTVVAQLGKKGDTPLITNSITVANNHATRITFKIPDVVPDGSYELTVTGSGGMTFTNSTNILLEKTTHMILIQLDKAIYKPNQMVRIRILSVDPENLSLRKIPTDITIKDGRGNKLDELKQATSDTGVISWNYELSDEPPLGEWKIEAKNEGGGFVKTFKVDKYVLPRFEVTVTATPSFILRSNEQITFTVKAEYTYGKPVQGEYRITVSSQSKKFNATGGSHDFVYNIRDLIGKTDPGDYSYGVNVLTVVAEVKEHTSQVTEKADPMKVKVYTHPVKITFGEMTSRVFRPGLPLTVQVKVTEPSGQKPDPRYNGKMVDLTMSLNELTRKKTVAIETDGTLITTFDIPADTKLNDYNSINLQAKVVGEKGLEVSTNIYPYRTMLNAAIKVNFGANSEEPFDVGSQFEITVQTTKVLTHVIYLILSRGDIVDSGAIDMKGLKQQKQQIAVTRAMAPKAMLIVYAIYDNGKEREVVADSLDLEVNGIFQNKVTLAFSKTESRVAENVKMTVTSDAESDFFVLAVDQSVLLLETGNDITVDGVKKEIEKFDIKEEDKPQPGPVFLMDRFFPWPRPEIKGPRSTGALIKAKGLLSMTDVVMKQGDVDVPLLFARGGGDMMMMAPVEMQNTNGVHLPSSPGGGEMAELGKARTYFPEAWLWIEDKTDATGKKTRTETVPDTITTWVATAFSISPKKGLAITNTPTKLTAFKPFFIAMTLPYSITRGETFQLRVSVYNYLKITTDVVVILKQSSEFDIVESKSSGSLTVLRGDSVKTVTVEPNVPKAVVFEIRPSKLGIVTLNVTAQPEKKTNELGDIETKVVLVKPEGIVNRRTAGQTVELSDQNKSFNETLYLAFPPADQVVPGSRRIEIKVTGDVMGPAISGLGNILHVPTGCGEQNMIGMTPNIYVSKYLKSVNSLTSKIKEKAIKNMKIGYQRELQFQRKDGSFSAFGDNDKSGSTWLTAFVLKSFSQARTFLSSSIVIDSEVMHSAFKWLNEQKKPDGLMKSVGFVCHQELMGGAAKGEALSAFVLIALHDSEYYLTGPESTSYIKTQAQQLMSSITAALEAGVDNNAITEPYDIAIVAYALTLVNSPKASTLRNKIPQLKKPWATTEPSNKVAVGEPALRGHHCCGANRAQPTDVELWSYVLLTYAHLKDVANGREIMKWLSKQQNGNGGFISTQDTILGLQSMSEFASLITSGTANMELSITTGDAAPFRVTLNNDNKLLLQSEVFADSDIKGSVLVSSDVNSVTIVGSGTGMAVVKIDYQYNTKKTTSSTGTDPNFRCTMEKIETVKLNSDTAKLSVCVKCAKGVGMTTLEVKQPTAFHIANEEQLRRNENIKKVEVKDSTIVLYMDEPAVEFCPEIHLIRSQIVLNVQPTAMKLSAYYKPAVVEDAMYELPMALQARNVCDVCERDECPQGCKKPTGAVTAVRLDALVLAGCICVLVSMFFSI